MKILIFIVLVLGTPALSQNCNDIIRSYENKLISKQDEILRTLKDQDSMTYGACFAPQANILPPDMLVDVAPGKKTYGSSVYITKKIDFAEYQATDGNEVTYFHSKSETNPWWMVDLAMEQTIYHVMILSRQDCCSERLHDLEIRLGNSFVRNGDFSSNQLLYYYKGPYKAEDRYLMYTFPFGVKGRYLSLQLNTPSEYLQVNEVKVIALRQ